MTWILSSLPDFIVRAIGTAVIFGALPWCVYDINRGLFFKENWYERHWLTRLLVDACRRAHEILERRS